MLWVSAVHPHAAGGFCSCIHLLKSRVATFDQSLSVIAARALGNGKGHPRGRKKPGPPNEDCAAPGRVHAATIIAAASMPLRAYRNITPPNAGANGRHQADLNTVRDLTTRPQPTNIHCQMS